MSLFDPVTTPVAGALFVRVALNLPLDTEFTYAVPPGMRLRVGNRVLVPFRKKVLSGVVVAVDADAGEVPKDRVRPVRDVLDAELLLPDGVLALARRMAKEYGCSLGEALDATLPAAVKRRGERRVPHLDVAVAPASPAPLRAASRSGTGRR